VATILHGSNTVSPPLPFSVRPDLQTEAIKLK